MQSIRQCLGVATIAAILSTAVWQARFSEPPHAIDSSASRSSRPQQPDKHPLQPETPRDLAQIIADGSLRVLIPDGIHAAALAPAERELLAGFAEQHGLTPAWITPRDAGPVPTALANGRADLAVSELQNELQDTDSLRYSLAWGVFRQQVIGRADTGHIDDEQQLLTRQLAVKRSSPAWTRLAELDRLYRTFELEIIPEATAAPDVLERVRSGRYDLAVLDSALADQHLVRYLDLQVKYDLTPGVPLAWVTRSGAPDLLDALNGFLQKKHLELGMGRVYRGDLDELRARNNLRLITYQGPASYYVERGRLKGFDYELVKRFAQENRMRLDVVVASDHEELGRLLLQGRGDLVAAAVPLDSIRRGAEALNYSGVYNHSAPVIVGRGFDEVLMGPRQLAGRRVVIPAESPFRPALEAVRAQGVDVEIVAAPPEFSTEEILFRVASGREDLTVLGSHQLKAELARQWNLKGYFTVGEQQPLAFVMRRADTQLKAALDAFVAREYRRGFYNAIHARYLERPNARSGSPRLLADVDRLSPYDEIVHRYADEYEFDWRLIVAQMYQESQFDPQAVSYAGATGLMQVLPATGQIVGITDLFDPHQGILAGIRYLDYLRDQFEDELLLEDRTWFTLAAYNAGPARVQQARRKAEAMHLDSDRWFGNVELAMLELAEPFVRDGAEVRACRCRQTVVYVRDIRTRYRNYVQLMQTGRSTASAIRPDNPS
jgi:membrane-bound lytic murein transglycosylase F